MPPTTILTLEDADNAFVLKVTVSQLRAYLDGGELNDLIKDLDNIIDECQVDVMTSGKRRWIMIEVVP